MFHVDLLLLHAPSVYDFRQKAIMYGPISDLIPSSPIFEMYPLGFLTMANYLEQRGLAVRIVNLALRMMNDPTFDAPSFLARLRPRAVGIDLHWLPHAHGALEVAHIVREIFPEAPIIFGGLSATYFHRELIEYPAVDYVLRGENTEPPLYELLKALKARESPTTVPNLTWKSHGRVHVNPLSFLPSSLDYVDIRPDRLAEMVVRYRDLESVLPFNGWWQNPITAVFTVKGCAHECVTCGNSRSSCGLLTSVQHPVFRSPRNLVRNIVDISRLSRGPIFLVGDLRQGGEAYADNILRRLKTANVKNEIVFELFSMPPLEYLQAIDASVRNWSLELSPESHDESIRSVQDETVSYSNCEVEAVIQEALRLRCHRLDVFFMIGLSGQTRKSVIETIEYSEHLFEISDRRLSCFISPMGPFLDPGSRGFENPAEFGYELFARTLEEHRQQLVQPSWRQILNYQTKWMSRDDLVETTYDAAERLNSLKLHYRRIDPAKGKEVGEHIAEARDLNKRLGNSASNGPNPEALQQLRGEIFDLNVSTVCDKKELFWKRHLLNFKFGALFRILFRSVWKRLFRFNRHFVGRMRNQ